MREETRAPLTVKGVHAAASVLLRERHHMGFRNFLGYLLLESRDPFRRGARRQLKRWVGVLIGVFLLGLLVLYYSHMR